MDIPILKDIAVIFGLAVALLWICHRLHLPSIIAFILAGVASGPHGLGLVKGIDSVETLSHIGIMLLLFTIGLEFSLKRLLQMKKYVFLGGSIQVALTTLIGFAVAQLLNRPVGESVFLGFLLAMSSTAIVSKALEVKDEVDSPQGDIDMGILIFQDLVAVPLIVIIPVLGNSNENIHFSFILRLLGGVAIIFAVAVAAVNLVPPLLDRIAKARNRELFLLSVLAICFAVAWLAGSMGLSLAIGAFLAGLIISDTEYNHEVIGNILPLQDIFASFFFVSIGMLLDLQFVLAQPFLILFIALAVVAMKIFVMLITTYILKQPLRIMILTSLALCQIGEFSFVLIRTGMNHELGTEYLSQLFLAVAILTMAITPTLIEYSHEITNFILGFVPEKWKSSLGHKEHKIQHSNHIVIIGFGVAGRNVARAAKENAVPYAILELNSETVKSEKSKGEPIFYGDASHHSVLHHVRIEHAKIIAVMINDPKAAKRIVSIIHHMNPNAYLIVRTRYLEDGPSMYKLGAHDVVPDEICSSVEVFIRVLKQCHVPQEQINLSVNKLLSENYSFN